MYKIIYQIDFKVLWINQQIRGSWLKIFDWKGSFDYILFIMNELEYVFNQTLNVVNVNECNLGYNFWRAKHLSLPYERKKYWIIYTISLWAKTLKYAIVWA